MVSLSSPQFRKAASAAPLFWFVHFEAVVVIAAVITGPILRALAASHNRDVFEHLPLFLRKKETAARQNDCALLDLAAAAVAAECPLAIGGVDDGSLFCFGSPIFLPFGVDFNKK